MSDAISQIEKITGEELKKRESIDFLSTDPESVENGYTVNNQGDVIALQIYGTTFEDLAVLNTCSNLRRLILLGCSVSDIEPLQNLTDLTGLHLGGNEISDVSPLQNLPNLTKLHLWENEIADIRCCVAECQVPG